MEIDEHQLNGHWINWIKLCGRFFWLSQLVEFGPAIAGLEDLYTEKIFVFIQARLFLKEHVQNLWYLWSKLHFEYRTWEQLGGHSMESLWVFKPKQRLGPREPPLGTLVLERLIRKAHAQEMAPSDSLTHLRHRTKIYNQDWSSVAMNKIRFHPNFPHLSWKFWPVYQCWIHSLYCFWRSTVDIAALENHRIGGGFLYKRGLAPNHSIFIQYLSNMYPISIDMIIKCSRIRIATHILCGKCWTSGLIRGIGQNFGILAKITLRWITQDTWLE